MPASVNNPVAYTYTSPDPPSSGSTSKSIPHPPSISKVTHTIAGIRTTTFGLAELPKDTREVAVLWLLHPRGQTETCMAPFASHLVTTWRKHSDEIKKQSTTTTTTTTKGLIAVSFDQRNHGTREISGINNESWREGNETHAQDMFSSYHGTATDTSLLIDYLPAYIFPDPSSPSCPQITQNVVLGISLGGHAAWQCLMHDPRVSSAIVTIGCPDYVRLMSDRARLSKRKSYTSTTPPGASFLGSSDFPPALLDAVRRYDPAGLLWGSPTHGLGSGSPGGQTAAAAVPPPPPPPSQIHLHHDLTDDEKSRLLPTTTRCFGNKRILNLAGGADKLVPYAMAKPFLDWLKKASGKGGWFEGGGLYIEDVVVPGCGHEVPPEMVPHMERFLVESLTCETEMSAGKVRGRRDSRI